jgi:hypothetical protein
MQLIYISHPERSIEDKIITLQAESLSSLSDNGKFNKEIF